MNDETRRVTRRGVILQSLATGPAVAAAAPGGATDRQPLPPQRPPARPDRLELLSPACVRLEGWLGQRVRLNARAHLPAVDTAPLLAGYEKRPGEQAWIGEHVGKWLHAATLAWAQTGDTALSARLDATVQALLATQAPDGYLGTYLPGQRLGLFPNADWDVWSHKYNLIGLLTYHRYTGEPTSLQACRRMADLLLRTFPAQRSILAAGTHLGMAATSVLEPMVLLFELTGHAPYLDFARYLVAALDEPGGPALLSSLLAGRPVHEVANGKAYELLSNLVGLVAFSRATGEPQGQAAALAAWHDIRAHRLTQTGSMSQWEHFQPMARQRLDVAAHVGETCVTTTWIQLNLALLCATGEARFAEEIERSYYNHLTAAQHLAGSRWSYYTPLQGRKWHQAEITCCHSSGPRALALAPQAAYLVAQAPVPTLAVNTLETSEARLTLGGVEVHAVLHSGFPRRGTARLTLRLAQPARFALRWRLPGWARPATATLHRAGQAPTAAVEEAGWLSWPAQAWHDGDAVELGFTLGLQALQRPQGEGLSWPAEAGRAARAWGPFVLALDQADNPSSALHRLAWVREPAARLLAGPGRLRFAVPVQAVPRGGGDRPARHDAVAVPYADAGAQRSLFRVHLLAAEAGAPGDNLLWPGRAIASRPGAVWLDGRWLPDATAAQRAAVLVDDDEATALSTRHGTPPALDWLGVALPRPVRVQRVVYVQGPVGAAGGWFDVAAGGLPEVQAQLADGAAWVTLGVLAGYPATTASDPRELSNGWDSHEFALALPEAVALVAVRVRGRPGGPRPGAHACARELRADGPPAVSGP
ncbi:MAG: glycoside hydrolase family 127 protein [Pelomonas sp.]|nr:glycoside hydrolase family 127 protein [Roseateles sp.]